MGQGNLLDLDATELDLAGVASDAALARAALGVARAQLARLLGRSLDATALVEDPAEIAGALDAVARAIAIRRLQEAGARYDDSVRELRVARAQWRRLAFVPRGAPPF